MLHHFAIPSSERVIIRQAKPSDAYRVIDYIKCISDETDFGPFESSEFNISINEEERIIKRINDSQNQVMMLANIGQSLVGMLTVSASSRSRMRHIGTIGVSVRKEHWGMGVASRLLDMAMYWAKNTRIILKLNLLVRTDNYRAISLYQRKGFVVEGTFRNEFISHGRLYDIYRMGYLIETC